MNTETLHELFGENYITPEEINERTGLNFRKDEVGNALLWITNQLHYIQDKSSFLLTLCPRLMTVSEIVSIRPQLFSKNAIKFANTYLTGKNPTDGWILFPFTEKLTIRGRYDPKKVREFLSHCSYPKTGYPSIAIEDLYWILFIYKVVRERDLYSIGTYIRCRCVSYHPPLFSSHPVEWLGRASILNRTPCVGIDKHGCIDIQMLSINNDSNKIISPFSIGQPKPGTIASLNGGYYE